MKIRNGFVSNSSSASFLVTWKCEGTNSIRDALYQLFVPSYIYDDRERKKERLIKQLSGEGLNNDFNNILKWTRESNDNLITEFWTAMWNEELTDFGDSIFKFLTALHLKEDRFSIIKTELIENESCSPPVNFGG